MMYLITEIPMPVDYRKFCAAALLAAGLSGTLPARAQSSDAQAAQGAQGAQGAVAMLPPVRVQAQVVAIDPGANSVTIKGPRGDVDEVTVDPAVADVSKLRVGDVLDIAYQHALLLRLDKTSGSGIRQRIDTEAAIPASQGRTAAVHRIDVIATVQKVDRKKRIIVLRGPSRTVQLTVSPDIDISHVKVGDSVHAVFETAVAVQVQPRTAAQ
jgi:Cu/Ag efflux protein CusF